MTRYESVSTLGSEVGAESALRNFTNPIVDVSDPEMAPTNVVLHLRVYREDDWFVVRTLGGDELLRRRRAAWDCRNTLITRVFSSLRYPGIRRRSAAHSPISNDMIVD